MNLIILEGFVGQEPKITNQGRLALVSLATKRVWTDRETGERREKTEWHRLKFWEPHADTVKKYVHAKSRLLVQGRMEYGEYVDRDGNTRHTANVTVEKLTLLNRVEAPDAKDEGTPF